MKKSVREKKFFSKNTFSDLELSIIFKELSIMTGENIPVQKSFKVIEPQFKGKKRRAIENIGANLNSGYSLYDSVDEGVLPNLAKSMILVGEESSSLTEIFMELSKYYKDKDNFKKKFRNAMTYPVILLLITVFVVQFLIIYVLPTFADILTELGGELPPLTQSLVRFSQFLVKYNLFILIGILIAALIIMSLFKIYKVRYRFDKFKFKFQMAKRNFYYRFTNTMSLSLNSKLPLQRAFEVSKGVYENLYVEEKLEQVRENIVEGMTFSHALEESQIFPPLIISLIRAGEESSKIGEVLTVAKDHYMDEVELAREKFTGLMEPVMILIMAAVVGFIVVSIAMPMFEVINKI